MATDKSPSTRHSFTTPREFNFQRWRGCCPPALLMICSVCNLVKSFCMARISGFKIAPEQDDAFFRNIKWGNEFVTSRFLMKPSRPSRFRRRDIVSRSLLSDVAVLWSGLTPAEQSDWVSAGLVSGQSGYDLFVQDTSYRIKNGLSGVAVPSLFHQYKVGGCIMSPSDTLSSAFQYHASSYFVPRRIPGTESRFEPVAVTETFSSYFPISFSMFSDLSLDVSYGYFWFVVIIYWKDGSESGQAVFASDLPLSSSWAIKTFYLNYETHPIVGYTFGFMLSNVTGTFLFDNVSVVSSGQNWAFDPSCDDIGFFPRDLGVSLVVPFLSYDSPNGPAIRSLYPSD